MPSCPSDTELHGFLNESLPSERVLVLASHIDGCPICQNRLDKLTHETHGAVARYKELSSVLVAPGAPAIDSASGSDPDSGTLIMGGNAPYGTIPRLTGLPRVPGFDVMTEIGRGGMGVVYKARHRRLNRLVALKMILAGTAADTRTVLRFLFEGETLARVQHPQVVQVFEVDTYQGPSGVPIPYMAIELLEGGSLSRRLKAGVLAPRDAAKLLEGIARAVHAAHSQGIVHRDLKPANILFEGGEVVGLRGSGMPEEASPTTSPPHHLTTQPKVTDFGLAKFIEAGADLTGSGQLVGTPQYMAPEQAVGDKPVGPAADIYALGAILFECLTGRPPFEAPEPMGVLLQVIKAPPPDVRSLRPDIPRDLAAVVVRCLDKEPNRRYASAEALADDLLRFLEKRPTLARPLGLFERMRLWAKRNPAVTGMLGLLAAVLVVAFGVITWLWVKAEWTAADERHATKLAKLSEARALKEYEKAQASLAEAGRHKSDADLHEAELEFFRAVQTCESGRVEDGLKSFVRVVELLERRREELPAADTEGRAKLDRAARLNIATWSRELLPTRRPFPHTEQPRAVAYHPDGQHMVTAGRDGEAYLWELATAGKVREFRPAALPPGRGAVVSPTYWAVSVSPDGKTVATGGSDSRITLWDVNASEPRLAFDAVTRGEDVFALAFAPDGKLWASDGQTGLNLWDVAARPGPVVVAHLTPTTGSRAGIVNALAVQEKGNRVYTGDRAGMLREWDVAKATEARAWNVGGAVNAVAISDDGTRAAATGIAGTVRVIDLTTGRTVRDIALDGTPGNGVAFATVQPLLLVTDGDGTVRAWHRDSGLPLGLPIRFSGEVTRVQFRPRAPEFTVAAGNAVYLCRLPEPTSSVLSAGHGLPVRGLDFSPSGERLALTDDRTFELFQLLTGKAVQTVERTDRTPLALRFDPDAQRDRVFCGFPGGLDWLTVPHGQHPEVVPSMGLGEVFRIEFVRGGAGFVAADRERVTRWDAAEVKQRAAARPAFDAPEGVELRALAARADGAEVLVAFGNRVEFLHADTLEPTRPGWAAPAEIHDACFTPDGKNVLIGRRDHVAELRDAATGNALLRPLTHGRAVTAVAISPDGKLLLTASRDGTARFWDAATGLPVGSSLTHRGPVTHVAFAPNGTHVATGTGSGHVMLWKVPPPPAVGTLQELRGAAK